jgi:parallel beta-helix repeat protein
MTIHGNKFYQNELYGFDPHDFTRDMLVENNEAYDNGNHGFIISRGCFNITFRGNKSYRNSNNNSSSRAHGFMLDPGGSGLSQHPSYNITLENNQAYDNEGYGLRMLDAQSSTVRNNTFTNNYHGITVERDSYNNLLEGNTIVSNTQSGIQLTGPSSGPVISARNNRVIGNTIERNGTEQILIRDTAADNVINGNSLTVVTTTLDSPAGIKVIDSALNNTWSQNVIAGASSISRSVQMTPTVHMGLGAPTNLVLAGTTVSGKAEPNARVEIFSSDNNKNTQYYEGVVFADANGDWSFTVPAFIWQGLYVTASQTVPGKGSSAFAPTVRP